MKTKLAIYILLLSFNLGYSQWTMLDSLTGGSIVSDLVGFKGNLYVGMNDHGVFQSKDNGYSWNKVNDLAVIPKLLVHKNQLYTFTYNSLAKSTDGETWTNSTTPAGFVNDVTSDSVNIYLVNHNGIFKSTNDGVSWDTIYNSKTPNDVLSIKKVDSVLFAGSTNGILLKSVNEGLTWESVQLNTSYSIKQICSSMDTIYLNTTDSLYKSSDYGVNWDNITGFFGNVSRIFVCDSSIYLSANYSIFMSFNKGLTWSEEVTDIPRYDISSIWVSQSNIFAGAWGGGVLKNSREIDQPWEGKNYGLYLTTINDIFSRNDTIICATQNSFIHSSFDGGLTWNKEQDYASFLSTSARVLTISGNYILAGDGSDIQRRLLSGSDWHLSESGVSGSLEDMVSNKQYTFAGTQSGVFRTSDNGSIWTKKSTGITSSIRSLFASEVYVFAGTWNGLFYSNNDGDTWTNISQNLPDKSINCMLYLDTVLFAATQTKGLFKTSDFGLHWKKISDLSVFTISNYKSYVFIGTWGGSILMSGNNGNIWTGIGSSLSDCYISAISFSNNEIYAGATQNGRGLCKRYLPEFLLPTLSFYSKTSDSTFKIGDSLYISSDQELRNMDTDIITSEMLPDIITIVNSKQQSVDFTAQITQNGTLISLFIADTTDGEYYTITVGSLRNKLGLVKSITISKPFRAFVHEIPIDNIAKTVSSENLILFPNPVQSKIKLSFDNEMIGIFKIKIFSISGNEIQQQAFYITSGKQKIELDLSDLPSGIYIVKVISSDNTIQKKIIKY